MILNMLLCSYLYLLFRFVFVTHINVIVYCTIIIFFKVCKSVKTLNTYIHKCTVTFNNTLISEFLIASFLSLFFMCSFICLQNRSEK